MKIKPSQFSTHLQRRGLASIYLITGDEPLQLIECMDTLRIFARANGFTERVVLTVEPGFDWDSIHQQADSLSLFAYKRFIEVRMGSKSPSEEGTKALLKYIERYQSDTILLLTADKLDSNKQKAKWFTIIDDQGVVVPIWPIEISQLPEWISQRLKKFNMQATSEAIQLIAERSEGHLLACAQEIEKLHLLYGEGSFISIDHVLEAVADTARFEIFDWVDTVLEGDVLRSVRQLQSLHAEASDPVLILWALNREIRNICQIAYAIQGGHQLEQVFKNFRVYPNRKNLIIRAVKRHSPSLWQDFLQYSAKIDQMIKGAKEGNPWDELLRLSLQISGVNLFSE